MKGLIIFAGIATLTECWIYGPGDSLPDRRRLTKAPNRVQKTRKTSNYCIRVFDNRNFSGDSKKWCLEEKFWDWKKWKHAIKSYSFECRKPCFASFWPGRIGQYSNANGSFPNAPLTVESITEQRGEVDMKKFGSKKVHNMKIGYLEQSRLQIFKSRNGNGQSAVIKTDGNGEPTEFPQHFQDGRIGSFRFLCGYRPCALQLYIRGKIKRIYSWDKNISAPFNLDPSIPVGIEKLITYSTKRAMPPRMVTVAWVKSTSVKISWYWSGMTLGGTQLYYFQFHVAYWNEKNRTESTVTTNRNWLILNDLESGVNYTLHVFAIDAKSGEGGVLSECVYFRTPEGYFLRDNIIPIVSALVVALLLILICLLLRLPQMCPRSVITQRDRFLFSSRAPNICLKISSTPKSKELSDRREYCVEAQACKENEEDESVKNLL